VVIIDFMSTSCPPCVVEILHLKEIQSVYGEQVVILSIGINPLYDSDDRLGEYMEELGVEWIMCRDTVSVSRKYDISILPTIVIIDQNGYVRFRHAGFVDEATISQKLAQLL